MTSDYTKQTWHALPLRDTPVSAARLQHIEDGLEGHAHAGGGGGGATNSWAMTISRDTGSLFEHAVDWEAIADSGGQVGTDISLNVDGETWEFNSDGLYQATVEVTNQGTANRTDVRLLFSTSDPNSLVGYISNHVTFNIIDRGVYPVTLPGLDLTAGDTCSLTIASADGLTLAIIWRKVG